MLRKLIPATLVIVTMASCSSVKPLNFTSNKQAAAAPATAGNTATPQNKNIKFLDDISVESQSVTVSKGTTNSPTKVGNGGPDANTYFNRTSTIEQASSLQLKYAVLLDTEVEHLGDVKLLESVDTWYGTRYKMGGTSKTGIDCSAFVQAVYLSAFAISLPRTAREQYKSSRIISATELKEGDLVFFNTRGGVSHVGIYLQNNKFAHASASQGVTVSDMFDPYYLKRYIGAGRIESKATARE